MTKYCRDFLPATLHQSLIFSFCEKLSFIETDNNDDVFNMKEAVSLETGKFVDLSYLSIDIEEDLIHIIRPEDPWTKKVKAIDWGELALKRSSSGKRYYYWKSIMLAVPVDCRFES